MKHFIGTDVGTGSARAGLFDSAGTLLGSAMIGAAASGVHESVEAAVSGSGTTIVPRGGAIADYAAIMGEAGAPGEVRGAGAR